MDPDQEQIERRANCVNSAGAGLMLATQREVREGERKKDAEESLHQAKRTTLTLNLQAMT